MCFRQRLNGVKPYFDEEGQSVLFEGKEAEDVMLSTLGKRHQVSKAVNKDRFPFQDLDEDDRQNNPFSPSEISNPRRSVCRAVARGNDVKEKGRGCSEPPRRLGCAPLP